MSNYVLEGFVNCTFNTAHLLCAIPWAAPLKAGVRFGKQNCAGSLLPAICAEIVLEANFTVRWLLYHPMTNIVWTRVEWFAIQKGVPYVSFGNLKGWWIRRAKLRFLCEVFVIEGDPCLRSLSASLD